MRILLSHDIDHLYWKQHYFRDLTLPKHVYRHTRAWLSKQIDTELYKKRMKLTGRLHRIPELLEFHKQHNTKACFFFGMDNALGLSYRPKEAKPWIKQVIEARQEVSVHGIAYANPQKIKQEYDKFKEISGLDTFGIRMHYLRMNGYTLEALDHQGYLFDSSIQGIAHPFKIGNLWEIPMSIMDSSLVPNSQSNLNLKRWQTATLDKLNQAEDLQIPCFVINHHDTYFDKDTFPTIYDWFHWLIEEIKRRELEVVRFGEVVESFNRKQG